MWNVAEKPRGPRLEYLLDLGTLGVRVSLMESGFRVGLGTETNLQWADAWAAGGRESGRGSSLRGMLGQEGEGCDQKLWGRWCQDRVLSGGRQDGEWTRK